MKVIDNIPYLNEDKMLNFRLHELNDIVDYFNIVEGEYTHQGNKKELNFNIKNFEKFKDKIIYNVNSSCNENTWVNEAASRNHLINGLKDIQLEDNDIILHGDLDEIPDVDLLRETIKNYNNEVGYVFDHHFYYYNIKTRNITRNFRGLVFTNYKNFKETFNCFNNLRESRYAPNLKVISGGWHFSYFGDYKQIEEKIKSFAHSEFNNYNYYNSDHLKYCIEQGLDLYYTSGIRNEMFRIVTNETYYPKNVHLLIQ